MRAALGGHTVAMGIEDPDADVVEQQRPATDEEVDPTVDEAVEDPGELPLEADPVDVSEQRLIVPEVIDEP